MAGDRSTNARDGFVAALARVLAERGFAALNVEAVAREAGFNKALVYRYFGGLEGLLQAFAVSEDFLPDLAELGQGVLPDPRALPPRRRLAIVLKNYARALRRRPATVQILLHAAGSDSPLARGLETGRRVRVNAIREALALDSAEIGLDLDAAMALFFSSFVMMAAHESRAMSMTQAVDADMFWRRIDGVVDGMLDG